MRSGEAIKGIKGVAKGVLPVAKALEGGFSYADQLGQRPGAKCSLLKYLPLRRGRILRY